MFVVYERAYSWGSWGQAERWILFARCERQNDAERLARAVQGIVVREPRRGPEAMRTVH